MPLLTDYPKSTGLQDTDAMEVDILAMAEIGLVEADRWLKSSFPMPNKEEACELVHEFPNFVGSFSDKESIQLLYVVKVEDL